MNEICNQHAFEDEEFRLMESPAKVDVITIPREFLLALYVISLKENTVKNFHILCSRNIYTVDKTSEKEAK